MNNDKQIFKQSKFKKMIFNVSNLIPTVSFFDSKKKDEILNFIKKNPASVRNYILPFFNISPDIKNVNLFKITFLKSENKICLNLKNVEIKDCIYIQGKRLLNLERLAEYLTTTNFYSSNNLDKKKTVTSRNSQPLIFSIID